MNKGSLRRLRATPGTGGLPAGVGEAWVEPHEELAARELILDQFKEMTGKRELPDACGYYIYVKIYQGPAVLKSGVNATGAAYSILRPDRSVDEDKYQSCTGLVVAKGRDAYMDKQRFPYGPWCYIGDWVIVPRAEGFFFHYHGVAMLALADDKIIGRVGDPTSVGINPTPTFAST